jgi:endo-1,4-beta-xylanase
MFKFSQRHLLSRRQALKFGIATVTFVGVLLWGKLKVLSYLIYTLDRFHKTQINEKRTFKIDRKTPLKHRAKVRGLIYGAYPQADRRSFEADRSIKPVFLREFNLIVAGAYWDKIRPSATTFDFAEPDYFANFATENKLLLRGHPLIWHSAVPPWFKETLDRQNTKQIMTTHIQTVVKRYAGRMHSWDVVNEAVSLKDGRSDGLRKSPWLDFLGPDYIEMAFRIAARSDPKARLVYNETDLEYDEAHQESVLKLLERLKAKGTPIYALGIQSHLWGNRNDFNPQKFRQFIKNVSSLGLKIMITELDVVDRDLPMDIEVRDRIVAAAYEDYLNAVLAERSVVAVINWGFTDRYNWVSSFLPRKDGAPARPLPFNADLQPKLAWNAISRAIDRAPKR